MHASESEVTQSCPTLSDPMDCSLSGCSVQEIFQARVLEWVAIAFSELLATIVLTVSVHWDNINAVGQSHDFSGVPQQLLSH